MRKRTVFIIALLVMLFIALPVSVHADGKVVEVSGWVNLSTLKLDYLGTDSILLTGDTYIVVDANAKIKFISDGSAFGDTYSLTLYIPEGGSVYDHTVTISPGTGDAITAKSVTVNASLDIDVDRGRAIVTNGEFKINAGFVELQNNVGATEPSNCVECASMTMNGGELKIWNWEGNGISSTGDVTIGRDATLNIAYSTIGIMSAGGSVDLDGKVNINTCSDDSSDIGIRAAKNIYVRGGAIDVDAETRAFSAGNSSAGGTVQFSSGVSFYEPSDGVIEPANKKTIISSSSGFEAKHVAVGTNRFYEVWIGTTQVSEKNKDDIIGHDYAKYDPATRTLYLTGAVMTNRNVTRKDYDTNNRAYIHAEDALTIVLAGYNSITDNRTISWGTPYRAGISARTLTIKGLGALDMDISGSGYTVGINASYLSIEDGDVKISANTTNPEETYCYAVYTQSNISVTGGSLDLTCNVNDYPVNNHYSIDGPSGYAYTYDTGKVQLTPATYYPVWVTGVRVSNVNHADVLGDGKVSYDTAEKILHLNGAELVSHVNILPNSGDKPWYESVIYSTGDLTVDVTGTNTITDHHTGRWIEGIACDIPHGLTITGDGSLEIDLESNNTVMGIAANALTIGGTEDPSGPEIVIRTKTVDKSGGEPKEYFDFALDTCDDVQVRKGSIELFSSYYNMNEYGFILPANYSICASLYRDGSYTYEATNDLLFEDRQQLRYVKAGVFTYDLTLGGVPVTKENCGDILEDGTAYYSASTRTLYLYDYEGGAIIANQPLTIVLYGNNVIWLPAGGSGVGIQTEGDCTLLSAYDARYGTAFGSLTIDQYNGTYDAIRAVDGSLHIDMDGILEISVRENGIYCDGEMTVTGSGRLDITCGQQGFEAYDNVTIGEDIEVSVNAGSYGIWSYDSDVIFEENSNVNVYGGNCGIVTGNPASGHEGGDVIIKDNAKVTVTGANYGVYFAGNNRLRLQGTGAPLTFKAETSGYCAVKAEPYSGNAVDASGTDYVVDGDPLTKQVKYDRTVLVIGWNSYNASDLQSDAGNQSTDGWKWDAAEALLYLDGYCGGSILAFSDLRIYVSGDSTISGAAPELERLPGTRFDETVGIYVKGNLEIWGYDDLTIDVPDNYSIGIYVAEGNLDHWLGGDLSITAGRDGMSCEKDICIYSSGDTEINAGAYGLCSLGGDIIIYSEDGSISVTSQHSDAVFLNGIGKSVLMEGSIPSVHFETLDSSWTCAVYSKENPDIPVAGTRLPYYNRVSGSPKSKSLTYGYVSSSHVIEFGKVVLQSGDSIYVGLYDASGRFMGLADASPDSWGEVTLDLSDEKYADCLEAKLFVVNGNSPVQYFMEKYR